MIFKKTQENDSQV